MRWSWAVWFFACGRSASTVAGDAGDAATAIAEPAPLIRGRVHELLPAPVQNEALRFVTTDFESRFCEVDDRGVSCRSLVGARISGEGSFRNHASIADGQEGAPIHVVVRRSVDKGGDLLVPLADQTRFVFASDEEILAASRKPATVDFVNRAITMEGARFTLHHVWDGFPEENPPLWKIDLPSAARMHWFFPWLVWSQPAPDDKSSRIFAMHADQSPGEKPARVVVPLGRIDDWFFDVSLACRTSAGMAVAGGRDSLHLLFERAGVWSLVTRGSFARPTGFNPNFGQRVRFDCSDDEIVASVVDRDPLEQGKPWSYKLRQLSCTPAGCDEWSSPFNPPDGAPKLRDPNPTLGRVGGTRVIFWETPSGIRMRSGELSQGPGVALFPSRVTNARLFGFPTHAFLLAEDGANIVGLRIAKDGTTTPIPPPKEVQ